MTNLKRVAVDEDDPTIRADHEIALVYVPYDVAMRMDCFERCSGITGHKDEEIPRSIRMSLLPMRRAIDLVHRLLRGDVWHHKADYRAARLSVEHSARPC